MLSQNQINHLKQKNGSHRTAALTVYLKKSFAEFLCTFDVKSSNSGEDFSLAI